ncbi:MAG: amidophosphoribosyltransferase [Candidatus Aminicenantes bacterium]|nr:amidophosphoribosyltransferase [Candidatus Aminicenantes bacterium]
MGGLFGVAAKDDCLTDLFFGTDYHSHLGTRRGGMVSLNATGFSRFIHNIENTPFRSKFERDIFQMSGSLGIGCISDYEDQPLLIRSHLGDYSIVTVGAIHNPGELSRLLLKKNRIHFSEMSEGDINPTELVASLINQEASFLDGIKRVQESVKGSCSLLLLTREGIYAARDRLGRTPVVLGKKKDRYAATLETCAFPNLEYDIVKYLGPGEIVFFSAEGIEQKSPPRNKMQICSFLWVYYGYPASSYEGINVEKVRNRCGAYLARRDDIQPELVAGIPDSGTAHGLGYAAEAGLPFKRPFVKYTPTWPRSFMPQDQAVRDLVAKMKLIPIRKIIEGKKLLFCEDSIVRGTQLKDTIQRIFDYGAKEVHMRPACPPLIFKCPYLNFSRSKSELDLAARKAIFELEGRDTDKLTIYTQNETAEYKAMVETISNKLKLTTLRYQRLDDLIKAIGLPKEKLCTFCWDGRDIS